MKLEIFTPEKELFSGEAKSVTLPGVGGSIGILDRHAPLITVLKKGDIVIRDGNQEETTFPVNGGVVEVQNSVVLVLAE
jgi:F-type H+-transporting ATPase subunit epsilon